MKNGWQSKPLGDLCEFQRGLTYAKGDEVDVSDNVVLRATNIDLTTNLLTFDELKYINDKVVVPNSKKVKKGSLMICTASGSKSHLGKVAYIDDDYGYAFGGFMGMVTPKNGLLPKYLFHLMTSPLYKDFIGDLSDGANINNLKFDQLKQLTVPHPSIPEQRRIVGILDEAFEGIANAKANAEKNLQNARALFESHLNAVFTQRGEGWVENRIPDVCLTFGRGKSRHRPRNEPSLYGGDYPFIQTGDLNNADHVVTTYTQTYSEKGLAQSKMWPKETVGIAIVGATIGETGVLGFDGCFPDSVIGMTADPSKADPYFIEYMLQHFKDVVKSQGEGSARHNINLATFDKLLFPMPSVTEQQRIVETADALKTETRNLESIYQRKLAALDELKKSLLHQAFSGAL